MHSFFLNKNDLFLVTLTAPEIYVTLITSDLYPFNTESNFRISDNNIFIQKHRLNQIIDLRKKKFTIDKGIYGI